MNKQRFIDFLRKPGIMDEKGLEELEALLGNYPYFQCGHALLAKSSQIKNLKEAKSRIAAAAVYSSDRVLLKKYIMGDLIFLNPIQVKESNTTTSPRPTPPPPPPVQKTAPTAPPKEKPPVTAEQKAAPPPTPVKTHPAPPPKQDRTSMPSIQDVDDKEKLAKLAPSSTNLDQLIDELRKDIENLRESKTKYIEATRKFVEDDENQPASKSTDSGEESDDKKKADTIKETKTESEKPAASTNAELKETDSKTETKEELTKSQTGEEKISAEETPTETKGHKIKEDKEEDDPIGMAVKRMASEVVSEFKEKEKSKPDDAKPKDSVVPETEAPREKKELKEEKPATTKKDEKLDTSDTKEVAPTKSRPPIISNMASDDTDPDPNDQWGVNFFMLDEEEEGDSKNEPPSDGVISNFDFIDEEEVDESATEPVKTTEKADEDTKAETKKEEEKPTTKEEKGAASEKKATTKKTTSKKTTTKKSGTRSTTTKKVGSEKESDKTKVISASSKVPKEDQHEIVDNFIKNNPSFAPRQEEKTDNRDLSKDSLAFHDDLASEYLAEIYLKQGKKDIALEIYNKLIVKYPEKSIYFADIISKIQ